MTTTLSEGVKVPDVGSVNWAGDLEVNWNLLNGALANLSGNVKLNVANTWTAEQTFSLPIVGSITGTASRAIADEDGTSIKTGYVNVAGNQTVSGQKTWSGNNTWGTNLLTVKDSAFTKGTTVTDRKQNLWKLTDSNDSVFGIWEAIQYTSGIQGIRLNVTNKYKNGALDPTGNDVAVYFEFLQKEGDGQTILKWANGLIDNGIYPLAPYGLGNNTYQWSSVYAQSYYYNGTAWGLDKENTWTGNNIFNKNINPASVTSIADTTLAFNGLFNTIFLNTRGSSNRRSYGSFLFVGYGSASGADNYGQIQLLRSTDKRGDTNEGYVPDTSFKLLRVNPHSLLIDFMENVRVVNDGTVNFLAPITTDATDLGTSTNKWKTLNGINPGALSLPKGYTEEGADKDYIDIKSVIQTLDDTGYRYTVPDNGWICVRAEQAQRVHVTLAAGWSFGQSVCSETPSTLIVSVPFRKGDQITFKVKATTLQEARFYPMLGNV